MIAIVVLAFMSAFCIVYRRTGDPVFLSMMLTYVLQLQDNLLFCLKLFAGVEQRMVSVDRCFKILE